MVIIQYYLLNTWMASSVVGVIVYTSSGCPWSSLVESSALSFTNNDRTNDSTFPVPVPIIRKQKPALQAHINKSEYVTKRMHTIVGVASFLGSPHAWIKLDRAWEWVYCGCNTLTWLVILPHTSIQTDLRSLLIEWFTLHTIAPQARCFGFDPQ